MPLNLSDPIDRFELDELRAAMPAETAVVFDRSETSRTPRLLAPAW